MRTQGNGTRDTRKRKVREEEECSTSSPTSAIRSNALSVDQLRLLTEDALYQMIVESPRTLYEIIQKNDNWKELKTLNPVLQRLTKDQLLRILNSEPDTLSKIANHVVMLDALADNLILFSKQELLEIFQKSPMSFEDIAGAACNGSTKALDAILPVLGHFTKDELYPILEAGSYVLNALSHSADARPSSISKGQLDAIEVIAPVIKQLNKGQFYEIVYLAPQVIEMLCQYKSLVDTIHNIFGQFSQEELYNILDSGESEPFEYISQAACLGKPVALNNIAPTLGKFSQLQLQYLLQYSKWGMSHAPSKTFTHIASAAWAGNPDALINILNVFFADLTVTVTFNGVSSIVDY